MTIIGKIIVNESFVSSTTHQDTGVLKQISDLVGSIPVVGVIWKFLMTTYSFVGIQEDVGLIFTTLMGIPLGYLILRLVRGGG